MGRRGQLIGLLTLTLYAMLHLGGSSWVRIAPTSSALPPAGGTQIAVAAPAPLQTWPDEQFLIDPPPVPDSPTPVPPIPQVAIKPAKPVQTAQPKPNPELPLAEKVYSIATQSREVVLTIDDGPSRYTAEILAILKEEQVPAAFFWIAGTGRLDLAGEIVAQGHQLGTHSMTHARLPGLTADGQRHELGQSRRRLEEAGQSKVHLFRPPYGAYDDQTLKIAQAEGLQVVLWNVDSRDWALANNPDQIVANVLHQVKPGSVILIHEQPQTVKVLPDLIKRLRHEGYTFRLLPVPQEQLVQKGS